MEVIRITKGINITETAFGDKTLVRDSVLSIYKSHSQEVLFLLGKILINHSMNILYTLFFLNILTYSVYSPSLMKIAACGLIPLLIDHSKLFLTL